MPVVQTDLYRRGNARSPRLTHVRERDLPAVADERGVLWVAPDTGGVSTFAQRGPGRNWWEVLRGTPYAERLVVRNDHGDHYSWEPAVAMTLDDFVSLLAAVERHFVEVT